MKKIFLFLMCISLILNMTGCSGKNETAPTETTNQQATDAMQENIPAIIPKDIPEGSDAYVAVKESVSEYLDTFISCDINKIKDTIHSEDQWLFNFESEDQIAFYKAIFPQIKYKLDFVSEHEGTYGVMAEITSPDMAEVYGTIITDYITSATSEDIDSVNDIMANSTEMMISMIKDPKLKRRCETLYIYVQYMDGEYITRCNEFLANELTGGAPQVNREITSTLYETIDALDN